MSAGVTSATFDLYGAQGGINTTTNGRGRRVTATLNVTPGMTYQILVGGLGDAFHNGFNGGGADAWSPAQGVLLKVQTGTVPNAGVIAVVYDGVAKAVRVSTLRLNTPTWTSYGNTPATFANGDKLLGCVQADGTVRVYRNNSLLTTGTLNAADQSFFNAKGGKIGLWTVAAPNAFFDDFGGGALTGVIGAALGESAIPAALARRSRWRLTSRPTTPPFPMPTASQTAFSCRWSPGRGVRW